MRLRPKSEEVNDGNIFWITMTDLMTGLVLVFIILFFYTYLTGHVEKIQYDLVQENASKSLQETLSEWV